MDNIVIEAYTCEAQMPRPIGSHDFSALSAAAARMDLESPAARAMADGKAPAEALLEDEPQVVSWQLLVTLLAVSSTLVSACMTGRAFCPECNAATCLSGPAAGVVRLEATPGSVAEATWVCVGVCARVCVGRGGGGGPLPGNITHRQDLLQQKDSKLAVHASECLMSRQEMSVSRMRSRSMSRPAKLHSNSLFQVTSGDVRCSRHRLQTQCNGPCVCLHLQQAGCITTIAARLQIVMQVSEKVHDGAPFASASNAQPAQDSPAPLRPPGNTDTGQHQPLPPRLAPVNPLIGSDPPLVRPDLASGPPSASPET